MKTKVVTAIIAGIAAVLSSAISVGVTVSLYNNNYIENSNQLVFEMEGEKVIVTPEKYEALIRENESLKNKNAGNTDKEKTDNSTQSASTANFMAVCPPYEVKAENLYKANESFKMNGKTYGKGFTYTSPGPPEDCYLLFNLDGKYNTLSFDFGHVDGSGMYDCQMIVYLDGEYVQTIEKKADEMVTNEIIALNHAKQLKLGFATGHAGYMGDYGLANMTVE